MSGSVDGIGPDAQRPPSVFEAEAFPDDAAAWAAMTAPGSATAVPLAVLDPARLSQEGRVDAAIALERLASWTAAQQQRLVAALACDPMSEGLAPALDRDYVREELRAALGESGIGARDRVEVARELTGRLSSTLLSLERGRITMRHARYLVDSLRALDDGSARAVERAVLPANDTGPMPVMASFRRKVRREIIRIDPRTAEQKLHDALDQRRVALLPDQDGTSTLWALLPAEGAQALMTVLDIMADQCASDDPRTKDQRRADALVQLALDRLGGNRDCRHCRAGDGTTSASEHRSGMPRWQGMRPSVQVTVALSTLLGYDDQPGDLDGYGPITAGLARRIAADETGTWRRLVTDEAGRLVDYGRTRYRPPADLAEFVIARDRTCGFPGCNRSACRCEIDHARSWGDDGDTNETNLSCLCARHHHMKHEARWTLNRLPDGSVEWVSPTGHRYHVAPAARPVDRTGEMIRDLAGSEHPGTDADPDPPHAADQDPPF